MLTGRSYTTSLGRPCLRESEASAGEFPLVFDGLGVFRGHFYRVIDFPNPRQNCHRTTGYRLWLYSPYRPAETPAAAPAP